MPDPVQNQPNPLSEQNPPVSIPEIPDLPPLPADAPVQPPTPAPAPPAPASPPAMDNVGNPTSPPHSGPTGLSDLPPIISPSPPKKFGGKKLIATIFGVLILIGGISTGVILVKQNQEIREKAGSCYDNCIAEGNTPSECRAACPTSSPRKCPAGTECKKWSCPSGWKNVGGSCEITDSVCCQPPKSPSPPPPEPTPFIPPCKLGGKCTHSSGCPGICEGINDKPETWFCSDIADNCPPPSPSSGDNCEGMYGGSCVPYNYVCNKGDKGKLDCKPGQKCGLGNCVPPSTPPPGCPSGWRCDKIYTEGTTCQETWPGSIQRPCKLTPSDTAFSGNCCIPPGGGGGKTPTPKPPPPGPGPTARCVEIKAYDTNWNQLTATQLSRLKVGDKVRFTVRGSATKGTFDKARFTINGIQRPAVTAKKPNTEEFYDEYTIPTGETTFTINAQVHHKTLGWF